MSRYYIVSLIFILVFIASLSLEGRFDMPVWWYAGLLSAYGVVTVVGCTVLSLQYFVPTRCGAQTSDTIAITFDDGPVPGKTEKILEILQRYNVKSSFFCIGHRVAEHPDLANQIHTEGHLLGNHSYWHARTFDLQSSAAIARELSATDDIVKKVVGVKMRFFRPPYGVTNPMVARAVRKGKYTVIGWSIRSFDTVIKDRAKLLKRTTRSLKGGDIVLFHDYSDSMMEILPSFLERAMELGLKVVRVDELLNEKAYA